MTVESVIVSIEAAGGHDAALALWLAAGAITQAQYCAAMARLAALPDSARVTL